MTGKRSLLKLPAGDVTSEPVFVPIVLGSLAIRLPFTLQYARERVAPEFWDNPVFRSVNARITAAWAGAFAVMLLAKLAVATIPGMPGWFGGTASILASIAAIRFTTWYPAHVRQARIVAQTTPAATPGA